MDLGLETRDQLFFLCIVSGNDYARHVPNYRLSSVKKWLLNVKVEDDLASYSAVDLVRLFEKEMDVSDERYALLYNNYLLMIGNLKMQSQFLSRK